MNVQRKFKGVRVTIVAVDKQYLLTYYMMQSPSWEANWFEASQEIPRISQNPKVHYRIQKHPPPVPVLYCTVQYSTIQYSTVQYSTLLYITVQYSTVQYSTIQYCTVQYSTVEYSTRYSSQSLMKLEFYGQHMLLQLAPR